jgi:hypothetical protein
MTGIRSVCAALFCGVIALPACGQLPQTRITSVFPPGAQVGTTVDITVGGGTDLDELEQMVFSHPGITAVPKTDANGNVVANVFTLTVTPEVPAGLYDVRVRGLFGVSNPRAFRVDTLPESVEVEPNNTKAQATPVTFGSVVHGRANAATDVDFFRIPVTAGQTLVVRSETAKLDSPMQPRLQLFDSIGRRLTEARRVFSQEASLIWKADQNEELLLRVQDAVYSGGDQFVYRLSFDSRPLADWISPTFVQTNVPSTVTVYGRHLPQGERTEKSLNGQAIYRQQVMVPPSVATASVGASATSAFADSFWWNGIDGNLIRVARSDLPAISEAADAPEQNVTLPFEATGSFGDRSDEDTYRFDAKKGESWVIEVFSQRHGSIADPVLLVERIVTAVDGQVTVTRLATEDDDRQNPGGADLPTFGDDPSFRLDVPEDGTYRIRLKDRYADTRGDPRLGYRLSVRRPQPQFNLVALEAFPSADGKAPVTQGAVSLRKGGSFELTVYAYRRDGHNDAITVTAENLPVGISSRPSVIGPGQVSARLVLTAAEDVAEQLAPIRVVGRSGPADALIERDAKAATLIHDAINGLPRTARLSDSLMAGVMKDPQPFSIVVNLPTADLSQDQLLLIPIQVIKRNGFDGKVDLSFYGLPGEIDAPAVAVEPGQTAVVAKLFVKEKAPVSTSTILVQGTSTVAYRRNPWLSERAQARVKAAEVAVAAQQEAVTKADLALKTAQQTVVTVNEQIKKLTDELSAYATQNQKLRDEFSKAVTDQKVSVDQLTSLQGQIAAIKADANSSTEQLNGAVKVAVEATAGVEESTRKLEQLNSAAGELARQIATAKEMEAAKVLEKTAAEADVAKRTKDVETAQAGLAAAQKEVEAANAAKTAADENLKKADEASKPNNVNVRAISEPMVLSIFASPAKLAAAVPDGGVVKKGSSVPIKVTLTRKNNFAGAMTVTLVIPDGIAGIKAEPAVVPADQTEGTITISAAADAAVGDISNAVLRATGDFNGRASSTDIPIAIKITD